MARVSTFFFLLFFLFISSATFSQVKKKPVIKKPAIAVKKPVTKSKPTIAAAKIIDTSTRVKIFTGMGEIVIRLSDKTPKHRDNFIKLVKDHFYDSLLFHRVIGQFMMQGGDPNSKNAPAGQMLGMGDVGYTIPAEFDTSLYHKKGALCAARTDNPEKASSGCQFYIVQGKKSSDAELDNISRGSGVYYSPAKRMTYKMNGGTPFLDMNYTVYGEVESGMDVVDKICLAPTDGSNRPTEDIRMRMELVERENKK